jgi:Domain of unknown function (DUF5666)
MKFRKTVLGLTMGLALAGAAVCVGQEPASPDSGGNASKPQEQGAGRGRGQGGPRPLMGKITSMTAEALVITKQDGSTVTVKLSDQTEFRKDREPAKAADFKIGDMVMVRGEENADHTLTAKMIGGRTGGPGGGPGSGPGGSGLRSGGAGGGPGGAAMGTLGKDYVAGEIKSIDAPKLTVLRTDNVTQTLELNEESSLRRGRDSITMADIRVGDHVMARGAVENGAFVPKGLMVFSAEQWQRMQQRMAENAGPAKSGDSTAPNSAPAPLAGPQE